MLHRLSRTALVLAVVLAALPLGCQSRHAENVGVGVNAPASKSATLALDPELGRVRTSGAYAFKLARAADVTSLPPPPVMSHGGGARQPEVAKGHRRIEVEVEVTGSQADPWKSMAWDDGQPYFVVDGKRQASAGFATEGLSTRPQVLFWVSRVDVPARSQSILLVIPQKAGALSFRLR